MKGQRERSKAQLDKVFLDMDLDVAVEMSGQAKDRVTLTHVFFTNRAVANKLLNDDEGSSQFAKLLRKLGFKRVQFADGFGTTYGADLNPEPEAAFGRQTLESMGVTGQLTLSRVDAGHVPTAAGAVAASSSERSPGQNLAAIDGADPLNGALTKKYAAKLAVLAPRCKVPPDRVADWVGVAWNHMKEAGHPTTCLDLLQGLANGTENAAQFGAKDPEEFCRTAMAAIVVIATAQ
jgi:hypothetical protein